MLPLGEKVESFAWSTVLLSAVPTAQHMNNTRNSAQGLPVPFLWWNTTKRSEWKFLFTHYAQVSLQLNSLPREAVENSWCYFVLQLPVWLLSFLLAYRIETWILAFTTHMQWCKILFMCRGLLSNSCWGKCSLWLCDVCALKIPSQVVH